MSERVHTRLREPEPPLGSYEEILRRWQQKRDQQAMGAVVLRPRDNTIDGARHDWEAGDLLVLPIQSEGTTHQHVNADPERPARLLVAEPNFVDSLGVDLGAGFEQVGNAPRE